MGIKVLPSEFGSNLPTVTLDSCDFVTWTFFFQMNDVFAFIAGIF